jgi:hypothetical protein
MKPMTTKQRDLRRYLFRGLIAQQDVDCCRAGDGPFVLTWTDARLLWRGATVAAIFKTDRKAGLQ